MKPDSKAITQSKTTSWVQTRVEKLLSICLGAAAGLLVGFAAAGFIVESPLAKTMAFSFASLCAVFYFFAQSRLAKNINAQSAILIQLAGSAILIILMTLAIHNFFQINPLGN